MKPVLAPLLGAELPAALPTTEEHRRHLMEQVPVSWPAPACRAGCGASVAAGQIRQATSTQLRCAPS